jgi:hypothetical protein
MNQPTVLTTVMLHTCYGDVIVRITKVTSASCAIPTTFYELTVEVPNGQVLSKMSSTEASQIEAARALLVRDICALG